jgi:hypothetical protein
LRADLLGPAPACDAVVIDGKVVRGVDVMLASALARFKRMCALARLCLARTFGKSTLTVGSRVVTACA